MKFRLAAALAVFAGRAEAHAFTSGSNLYAQFTEGVGIVLTDPRLILPMVAVGITASLANVRGFARQWGFLVVGIVAGQLIAPAMPVWIMAVALGIGTLMALIGIALWFPMLNFAALLVGVTAGAAALEGHSFGEASVLLRIGLVFAFSLVAAVPAGLASMALERFPSKVTVILLRIVLSWCAAIAIMLIAFSLKGIL
ncbi:MAG: hypothetical protein ABI459_00685 [Deltaproteobacteria bacterium]